MATDILTQSPLETTPETSMQSSAESLEISEQELTAVSEGLGAVPYSVPAVPPPPQQDPFHTTHIQNIQNKNKYYWKPAQWIISSIYFVLDSTITVLSDIATHLLNRAFKWIKRRNQVAFYQRLMKKSSCYEQWAAAGYMLDRCQGKDEWKEDKSSTDYNAILVDKLLRQFRKSRMDEDDERMMFNLRTTTSRNLAGMGNQAVLIFANQSCTN